jgi:hypothetical protein
MHNGRNLVGIHATSNTKFINQLMEVLFTAKERHAGLIKEKGSTSTRAQLDPERVKKVTGGFHLFFKSV